MRGSFFIFCQLIVNYIFILVNNFILCRSCPVLSPAAPRGAPEPALPLPAPETTSFAAFHTAGLSEAPFSFLLFCACFTFLSLFADISLLICPHYITAISYNLSFSSVYNSFSYYTFYITINCSFRTPGYSEKSGYRYQQTAQRDTLCMKKISASKE